MRLRYSITILFAASALALLASVYYLAFRSARFEFSPVKGDVVVGRLSVVGVSLPLTGQQYSWAVGLFEPAKKFEVWRRGRLDISGLVTDFYGYPRIVVVQTPEGKTYECFSSLTGEEFQAAGIQKGTLISMRLHYAQRYVFAPFSYEVDAIVRID